MKEESYQLNPKGALMLVLSETDATLAITQLELIARRHHAKDGIAAIVFDDGCSFQTINRSPRHDE